MSRQSDGLDSRMYRQMWLVLVYIFAIKLKCMTFKGIYSPVRMLPIPGLQSCQFSFTVTFTDLHSLSIIDSV